MSAMQEAEEQDTCRICSGPAEPDQPLFHPCKCSGTIRYIHQECLTTWLAHSKKKDCDVCKHPYSFNKVYAENMPARLPPLLLLRHILLQTVHALFFAIRAVIVSIIWLCVLPWITIWTWRLYFTIGDSTAWWISNRPRPQKPPGYAFYSISSLFALPNDTSVYTSVDNSSEISNSSMLLSNTTSAHFQGTLTYGTVWKNVSADIFAGQIIAALVVLTFLSVFLLREWIAQNARPGMFDDEPEALQDDLNLPDAIPAIVQAQPPAAVAPVLPQPEPAVLDNDRPPERLVRFDEPPKAFPDFQQEVGPDYDAEAYSSANHIGNMDFVQDINAEELLEGEVSDRVEETPGKSFIDEDQSPADGHYSEDEEDGDVPSFEWGFDGFASGQPALSTESGPVALSEVDQSTSASQPSSPLRRPPLPFITLPSAAGSSPLLTSPLPSAQGFSRMESPQGSPSLATYRAPEELEAGPSSLREEYFGDVPEGNEFDLEGEDLREARNWYFRKPRNSTTAADMDTVIPSSSSNDGESVEYNRLDELRAEKEDEEGVVQPPPPPPPQEGVIHPWIVVNVDAQGRRDEEDEDDEDDDLDRDNDDPELDLDRIEIRVEVDGERAPPPALPAFNADQLRAGQEIGQEFVDDLEMNANPDDDMEGALEAIGLRGPIGGMIQNVMVMIFVLDTSIGLGVWVPFTIGKSAALLSLNPRRALELIHLPIKAIRTFTDPIVDMLSFMALRLFIGPGSRLAHRLIRLAFVSVLYLISKVFGSEYSAKIFEFYSSVKSSSYWEHPLKWLASGSSSIPLEQPENSVVPIFSTIPFNVSKIADSLEDSWIIEQAEPYFAMLGKEMRETFVQTRSRWIELALGYGTKEKVFAIFLGYCVIGLMVAVYLNVLTVGNMRSAGRAVRGAVKQQLVVFKVALFILIELVIFPFACGTMLDVCTLWLFPNSTMKSRSQFFSQAPVTASFYHWIAGTMFMYQFAVIISSSRRIMRPGAMWFIKDPKDRDFHPIRDILERPTLLQLRKIIISAFIYALVVIFAAMSVAGLLFLGGKSILPLRIKTREPLSSVPVDLMFLHVVLPYTMHYFRPRRFVFGIVKRLWKYLAFQLRLTSYMFGGRHPAEEVSSAQWSFKSLLQMSYDGSSLEGLPRDGGFKRVPAKDNLPLPRDGSATADVNEDEMPIDEEAQKIIETQDEQTWKAGHDPKNHFTMVYLPPHTRRRFMAFVVAIWTICALALAVSVALPLQIGRMLFSAVLRREVHDGYSLIAGFYLLWACYLFGKAVDRMDRHRQRKGGDDDEPRGSLRLYVLKHGTVWLVSIIYMVFFLGFVIPTLLAIAVEMYLVLPFRLSWNPTYSPKISIMQMWACGLIYQSILVRAHRRQRQQTPWNRALTKLRNNGWSYPDALAATTELIIPATLGLLGMLLVPAAAYKLMSYYFPVAWQSDRMLFTNIYPGIFTFIGLGRMLASALDHVAAWSQEVRDKEFLVEMRLKNHEPDTEDNTPELTISDKGKNVVGRPVRWVGEEEDEIL